MNSLEKMAKLADKFETKLAQITQESNIKAAISDAVFGPPAETKNNESFQRFLGTEAADKFQMAIGKLRPGTAISIGASVDAPQGIASILVAPRSAELQAGVNDAYMKHYGQMPSDRIKDRKAKNLLRPADLKGAAMGIITFTL